MKSATSVRSRGKLKFRIRASVCSCFCGLPGASDALLSAPGPHGTATRQRQASALEFRRFWANDLLVPVKRPYQVRDAASA